MAGFISILRLSNGSSSELYNFRFNGITERLQIGSISRWAKVRLGEWLCENGSLLGDILGLQNLDE